MTPTLTITAPRTAEDLRIGRRVHRWLRSRRIPAELAFDGATVKISMPYRGARDIGVALDASTAWSIRVAELRPLPPLYESGVRYAREPLCRIDGRETMCEEFTTAHETLRRGRGDCDDLGPWRATELRLAGEPAKAFARRSRAGWHVVVRRADGRIEDPSAKLGMPTR